MNERQSSFLDLVCGNEQLLLRPLNILTIYMCLMFHKMKYFECLVCEVINLEGT